MVKVTVTVEGMMCPMCEAHTNEAIRNAMSVKSVKSSHKEKKTEIIGESLSEDAIKAAIEATGYKVLDIVTEPYKKECFLAKLFRK